MLYSEITCTVETARELGLKDHEFQRICDVLGRVPTYTELGVYSVMWSEHCSYKNSILQLKTLPRSGGRMLVEAGEENAGLIDIGEGYAIAFKIESHNHPSAIEPVQGAATGVGGILRDIFTMGARPIAALNSLRFGNLTSPRTKFLVRGVVQGIGHYGNCFGVPTVGGEVYFDECYTGNPLVNAMAVGIVKVGHTASAEARGVGNPVFILGSRTGRDGIRGASMASADFEENPEDMRPTVQVGDPFAEKVLLEATLELIASGAVVGMQDMGAAGICCSTSEMSAKGKVGMDVNLDHVPLREPGMSGFEIMLSESQERMLAVIEKGKEHIAQAICDKWDVPFVQIGTITDTQHIRVFRHGQQIVDIPAQSLVLGGGAPVYEREWREPEYLKELQAVDIHNLPEKATVEQAFWMLLSSPTIASKRWIYEQYDSQVGTNTVTRAEADASVIRLKELPGKAIAVSTDCNSRYVYADPYKGGMIAVAEAARNVACTGAEPVAITNCLNFGNPYDPEVYWQFKEAIRGMGTACRALGTPVTGGNVSFHNESQHHAVFPTPTIGMLGLIDDVTRIARTGFTNADDVVVLMGVHRTDHAELGMSEYLKQVYGMFGGTAPSFEIDEEVSLQKAIVEAIRTGLVHSAHDTAEGGLAIALAECAIHSQGELGADIDVQTPTLGALYGEAQSRIVVSCSPEKEAELHALCARHGVASLRLGRVVPQEFRIVGCLETSVWKLREVFFGAIERVV